MKNNIVYLRIVVLVFMILGIGSSLKAQNDIFIFDLSLTPSWGDTVCGTGTTEVSIHFTNTGNTVVDSLYFRFETKYNILLSESYLDSIYPGDTIVLDYDSVFMFIGPHDYSMLYFLAGVVDTNRVDTIFIGINCLPGFNNISNELKQITIYPNPAISQLNLDIEEFTSNELGILAVFNSLGQEIESIHIPKGMKTTSINIDDYSKGVYFIRLQKKQQVIAVGKFVKE
ncbi:MAG: T9SS type A sorting domain-containing protein [Bacteroidales bacterium]|nr:T9SS type A sorting domain-containing protein [Bacteroidales bacterium]